MKYIIYSLYAVLLMSLSSCLKDGYYTVPLEEGDTREMVLGIWQITEYKLYDASDKEYANGTDDDDLVGQVFVIDNNGKGTIIDGESETEMNWVADGSLNLLTINGVQYEIISLGESLMVLKRAEDTGDEVKHYFLTKKESIPADDNTIIVEGIPSDELAGENPTVEDINTNVPNFQCIVEKDEASGYHVARFDMTGISIPGTDNEWLQLFGTGMTGANAQNIWISIDNKPKGILVQNNSAGEGGLSIKTDIVFLVDNSGSMGDEADRIAEDITEFAMALEASGLDVMFACVGYNDNGRVSGALDISNSEVIYKYLNERGEYGTNRTVGFYGDNSESLMSLAKNYYSKAECGVVALRFADENFTFRSGANRVYINFTDEPNQPGGNTEWSVEYVNNQKNWPSQKGTVHTVFSAEKFSQESLNYQEFPWKLSDYTGGTTIYTDSSFKDVNLIDLPVTAAMQNSYVIKFTNIEELLDGKVHKVKITILSSDGSVRAEKIFDVVFTVAS